MSKGRIDRRDFIKGAVLTGAGLALGGGLLYVRRSLAALLAGDQGAIDQAIHDHKLGQISDADAQATVAAYMTSGPAQPRVVHVHSDGATSWNGETDYWNYVDQSAVDSMVDQGVLALTGASTVADAWRALLPVYQQGQGIAIKVNFNNCGWCASMSGRIDALIHPINAVVHGLLRAYPNFETNDIWVYDASIGVSPRQIPQRFKDGCLYSGVRFFDQGCNETAGYASTDPTAAITWHNPPEIPMPPPVQVTDVLVDAAYLINMPIMKRHTGAGVTLAFKNHFGSLANVAPLHDWVFWGPHSGGTTYNPLVDIYRNAHILGKTVLTIGDALFGNWKDNWDKPSPWTTFGDTAPNSLLFATDPVALDCVMCDLLDTEVGIWNKSDDYLVYAAACGLGTFERGDPWGSGYSQIDYLKIEL